MSRIMSRQRIREGRGIGERITEIAVYVVIVGALAYGAQWYFLVHLRSPGPALQSFLNGVKSGNVERQYNMLSASYRASVPLTEYEDRNPLARSFTERIASYAITTTTLYVKGAKGWQPAPDGASSAERAEADVAVQIRRTGQELYQASTDVFNDHYVLVHQTDGWKVALDDPKTKLNSLKVAGQMR